MVLAWATRASLKPPLIAIGANKSNSSHRGIAETVQFSLCMPTQEMVTITDYVGLFSAQKTDKSHLFSLLYGKLEKAPLIEECPLCLGLSVYNILDLPTNTVFIGEIQEAYSDKNCLKGGVPEIEATQPFLLTMQDKRYWHVGSVIGNAWDAGQKMKQHY